MCAREMNSEKAANGPCAREAYYYGKCVNYEADNDVSNYHSATNYLFSSPASTKYKNPLRKCIFW